MHKLMSNLEETNRKDLTLRRKGKAGNLRGHKKKLVKEICSNDKKVVFSQRIDTRNGQKEKVIMANNVHQLKEILDKCRYGLKALYITTR